MRKTLTLANEMVKITFITLPALARVSLFQMLYFSDRCGVYATLKSTLTEPNDDKQY